MDVLEEQVARDLKARGFKIVEKIEDGLFIAEKNERYLFYVLIEGVEKPLRQLYRVLNLGESISTPVILALVSNDGVVTYYSAHKLKLPRNIHVENI
ncbi:tRNA splicing endonuclease [Thermoproteus tenax]|uniref:tRNA splicing endonuclease n=1 Tax=Thermoproteus tenax (strain ATCC 35583 / DSM 2078 / JCM 9277 / NBRC 100435 / Kra 1) TaxID=768679 RepID=G4RLR5_THETK|nr:tRNA splicing endonuclease [Thermoproteus tenax]CCC82510.1 tRNA splicing endonuclease [Thermoproteus tenax Kra 1]